MTTYSGSPTSVSQSSTGLPTWTSVNGWLNTIYASDATMGTPSPSKEQTETIYVKRNFNVPAGSTPVGLSATIKGRVISIDPPGGTAPIMTFAPQNGSLSSLSYSVDGSYVDHNFGTSMHGLTNSEWWAIANGTNYMRFYGTHYLTRLMDEFQVFSCTMKVVFTLPPSNGSILIQTL